MPQYSAGPHTNELAGMLICNVLQLLLLLLLLHLYQGHRLLSGTTDSNDLW